MNAQRGAATAVTIFHRTDDVSGFDGWLSGLRMSASSSVGFSSSASSVRDDDLDWAMSVTFVTEGELHRWLDGEDRRTILKDGQSLGFWCRTTDLFWVRASTSPPG